MRGESTTLRVAGPLDAALAEAQCLLDAGAAAGAQARAQEVLRDALAQGDRWFEARALDFLAHGDRMVSRFRRSHEASQRAAHLYKTLGDPRGEALALSTLTYVASCLGRHEDAVEAGLLCLRLSEHVPGARLEALACNNLGVAWIFAGCFEQAGAMLESAMRAARQPGSRVTPFQPATNLAGVDLFRMAHERSLTGALPDPAQFCERVERAVAEAGDMGGQALQGGMHVTVNAMYHSYLGLARCWGGHPGSARSHLAQARQWAARYGVTTWLQAFERWFDGELHWSLGDLPAATRSIEEALAIAAHVEHEHLACCMQSLLVQLHELQGSPQRALQASRELRRRESRIRAESVASRERIVRWQLESRERDRSLQRLESESRRLQRMSMEDPLTGIANRRSLEARLEELLPHCRDAGQPLSVALVDVDRFKQVNDSHGHAIGDQVLRAIAGVLCAHVREHDLVARLSGDEFVVVFPRATASEAEGVCHRMRAGLRSHAWHAIAPGLCVSASVGVAEAGSDDSMASLLSRADAGMYRDKRGGAR